MWRGGVVAVREHRAWRPRKGPTTDVADFAYPLQTPRGLRRVQKPCDVVRFAYGSGRTAGRYPRVSSASVDPRRFRTSARSVLTLR